MSAVELGGNPVIDDVPHMTQLDAERHTERTASSTRRWCGLLGILIAILVFPSAAWAGDTPAGFFYGIDGSGPTINSGTCYPCQEPNVTGGGTAGVYIGEMGGWQEAYSQSCGSGFVDAFNPTDFDDVWGNHANGKGGVGNSLYWFLGGPGVDPNYNGTATEAYNWGAYQAYLAASVWTYLFNAFGTGSLSFHVIWGDIEPDGNGLSTGWYSFGNCSRVTSTAHPSPNLDRNTFNGYWDYLVNVSNEAPGMYSASDYWNVVASGHSSLTGSTLEWTYQQQSGALNPGPSAWIQGADHGEFFGGQSQSSPTALMWQWHEGAGDYDQLDASRY
jgi:hypothetical protein